MYICKTSDSTPSIQNKDSVKSVKTKLIHRNQKHFFKKEINSIDIEKKIEETYTILHLK